MTIVYYSGTIVTSTIVTQNGVKRYHLIFVAHLRAQVHHGEILII